MKQPVFTRLMKIWIFVLLCHAIDGDIDDQAQDMENLQIGNVSIVKENFEDVMAMVQDELRPGNIIVANKSSVYTMNMKTLKVESIVGGAGKGYAEGTGSGAIFRHISVMEIGPTPEKVWVSDWVAGCVREINLVTNSTSFIVHPCHDKPKVQALSTEGVLTLTYFLTQHANDRYKYYAGSGVGYNLVLISLSSSRSWVATKLQEFPHGMYDMVHFGDRFVSISLTDLWSAGKEFLLTKIAEGLSRGTIKKLLPISNRTLLSTTNKSDTFILDTQTGQEFSLCEKILPAQCRLSSVLAMVKHPTTPMTVLLAGKYLYSIPIELVHPNPATTVSTSESTSQGLLMGVLIVVIVGLLIAHGSFVTIQVLKMKRAKERKHKNKREPKEVGYEYYYTYPQ